MYVGTRILTGRSLEKFTAPTFVSFPYPMPDIRPFRAWRYASRLTPRIGELTSPLFDVVTDRQREALYREPLNSIHLSVPLPEAGLDAPATAARTLARWRADGVLVQDPLPGIYAYYQTFQLPGATRPTVRRGFLALIRATDWADRAVLRHEDTIPAAVNDRTALLTATRCQTSATHGLYHDPAHRLEPLLDEAIMAPIYETEDYQGVRDTLAPIHDRQAIALFQRVLAESPVVLADGHHRYEGSLHYRHARAAANPHHTGEEDWNFHLMYLTNSAADDLRILPTHRVLRALPLANDAFLARLEEFFMVTPREEPYELPEIIAGKPGAFGLYLRGGAAYKLRLRPEASAQLDWPVPPAVAALDLTILHHFVFERVLGLSREEQRRSPELAYVRSVPDCLHRVDAGEAAAAFITNEVTMAEVLRVCESGALMPQKSTFFYPKVIGGFLFAGIAD